MKVELEKITLAHSPLTDKVYIGTLTPTKSKWRNKVDITNIFIDCVISRWENKKEIITCGTHEWEITVKKIKS